MTHPIITKKVEELVARLPGCMCKIYREECDHITPDDITQAMEEAYEAGQADSAGEEMRRVQWRKDIETEAQRETAREILKEIAGRLQTSRLLADEYEKGNDLETGDDPAQLLSDELSIAASLNGLHDLISSKYLAEDSPKNETA